ncbi:lysophospholipase catalytic domain-containing protein [Coniochaeta sp. 2T2.1]|nr:lysophospholipase catalytic domain-containing protein [Coniochaeta sp. 2T2.1]
MSLTNQIATMVYFWVMVLATLVGCGESISLGRLLLGPRAKPDAPDGYAPAPVTCPVPLPAVRPADALSPQEALWLARRANATNPALISVLQRASIEGIDVQSYLQGIVMSNGTVPRIGIALSGGGYRAMMTGAGALAAFDNRTTGSTGPGQLGGILQASTYISGLSGGSWLVGSLYTQNFTTVESIVRATDGFLSELWQFNESIIEGPATLTIRDYYQQIQDAVRAKADAGYNTTITDYWGRALSYQLLNATDGGPAYTFSSIATDTGFAEATVPMPIIVALERPAGQILIWENSTVIEFNPWEMGSHDAGNPAFVPLRYVGSAFTNGTLPNGSQCISGVDNVGFVFGTSSSLFNQAFLQLGRASPDVPEFIINSLNATLANISEENTDIASWPNPFFQYRPVANRNANSTTLDLVDGGEDLQNIPFDPLLWSLRAVDVILAVDGSADTITHWPNGTALVATYQRSLSGDSTPAEANRFPPVPDQNTIVNLGLNRNPAFFGCDTADPNPGPIVVYLPNAPYSNYSNVSTVQMEFTHEERQAIIGNGYNVVTMANATVDKDWPACLGCAILERSFRRTGTQAPSICGECFDRYCWNGTVNETKPATYDPTQVPMPSIAEKVIVLSAGVESVVLGAIFWALVV